MFLMHKNNYIARSRTGYNVSTMSPVIENDRISFSEIPSSAEEENDTYEDDLKKQLVILSLGEDTKPRPATFKVKFL